MQSHQYKHFIKHTVIILGAVFLLSLSWIGKETYESRIAPLVTPKTQSIHASQSGLSLEDHTIYTSPNTKNIQAIVKDLDQARDEIKVMIYILSERDIKAALKRAHERGVKVEIILENEIFGNDAIAAQTRKELMESGIRVIDPDHDRYTFTHAKMIIIDQKIYYVGTGNFSYSSFKTNKEFFIR